MDVVQTDITILIPFQYAYCAALNRTNSSFYESPLRLKCANLVLSILVSATTMFPLLTPLQINLTLFKIVKYKNTAISSWTLL